MRISDWSSDVCSSDLRLPDLVRIGIDPDRSRLPVIDMRQLGFLQFRLDPDVLPTDDAEDRRSRPHVFAGLEIVLGDDSTGRRRYDGVPEVELGLIAHRLCFEHPWMLVRRQVRQTAKFGQYAGNLLPDGDDAAARLFQVARCGIEAVLVDDAALHELSAALEYVGEKGGIFLR